MVRIGTGPPFWQINHANSAYFRLFLGYFRVISATRPPLLDLGLPFLHILDPPLIAVWCIHAVCMWPLFGIHVIPMWCVICHRYCHMVYPCSVHVTPHLECDTHIMCHVSLWCKHVLLYVWVPFCVPVSHYCCTLVFWHTNILVYHAGNYVYHTSGSHNLIMQCWIVGIWKMVM